MSDENPQAGSGASTGVPPQQGTPPPSPEPGDGSPSTQAPNVNNPEAKKYADEAAAARAELKKLQGRIAQFEQAQKQAELDKLGDLEKAHKQLDEYKAKVADLEIEQQQYRLAREITRLAPKLGLVDPDLAMLALQNGGELETDDRGNYTNVERLLEKLVADRPYLLSGNGNQPKAPPQSGGATNPGRGQTPTANQPRPDAKTAYQQRRALSDKSLWKQ
jgi:hypothetical protein